MTVHVHAIEPSTMVCECGITAEQLYLGEICGPWNRHNEEMFALKTRLRALRPKP